MVERNLNNIFASVFHDSELDEIKCRVHSNYLNDPYNDYQKVKVFSNNILLINGNSVRKIPSNMVIYPVVDVKEHNNLDLRLLNGEVARFYKSSDNGVA